DVDVLAVAHAKRRPTYWRGGAEELPAAKTVCEKGGCRGNTSTDQTLPPLRMREARRPRADSSLRAFARRRAPGAAKPRVRRWRCEAAGPLRCESAEHEGPDDEGEERTRAVRIESSTRSALEADQLCVENALHL